MARLKSGRTAASSKPGRYRQRGARVVDPASEAQEKDPFHIVQDLNSSAPQVKDALAEVAKTKPVSNPNDEVPSAARIALPAVITVGGREHVVQVPIPGLEYLFTVEPVAAELSTGRVSKSSALTDLKSAADSPKSVERAPLSLPSTASSEVLEHPDRQFGPLRPIDVRPTSKSLKIPPILSLKPSRMKRKRRSTKTESSLSGSSTQGSDDETYGNGFTQTMFPRAENSLYIFDIAGLEKFYCVRFKEITMKPLRQIVTAWVRTLAPDRIAKYGAYHNKRPSEIADGLTPAWWPRQVPYTEPSHLKLQDLIPLACQFLFVHRKVDEECGKRKRAWVADLQYHAVYCVKTIPNEHFSSSKGDTYNAAMKQRALNVLLPTLFNVAQLYEDYVHMHQLYEENNNLDPGTGKHVTWQHASRPHRTKTLKRPRSAKRAQRQLPLGLPGHNGSDTEIDEDSTVPDTAASSFLSQAPTDEFDAKVEMRSDADPEDVKIANTNVSCVAVEDPTCRTQKSQDTTLSASFSNFNQSMTGLCLDATMAGMDHQRDNCILRMTQFPTVPPLHPSAPTNFAYHQYPVGSGPSFMAESQPGLFATGFEMTYDPGALSSTDMQVQPVYGQLGAHEFTPNFSYRAFPSGPLDDDQGHDISYHGLSMHFQE